ncbi:ABC transporter substrate-binding protein [Microbacterium sp.]|uniref:ABC transporter substrate-binding protein n=1 Tax=Microbacterium sp. TaxID=51671 RepID=UPI003A908DBE
MQRRTPLVFAAAAAIATLTLTACSNNPSSGGDGEEAVLTFFAMPDAQDAYGAVIDKFEAENPGVTINLESSPDVENILLTQLQAGQGPDLIPTQPNRNPNAGIGTTALASKGYLADLSDEDWVSLVPEKYASLNQYEGKTYAYPGIVQPLGAFYNAATLEETGLEPPETWSEVLEFCADSKDAGKVAYSLGYQDIWITQLIPLALATSIVYGPTPDWDTQLDEGSVQFTDEAWTEVFEKVDQMKGAGCFTPDPAGVNLDAQLSAVAAGDAVGVVHVGGVFSVLEAKDPELEYVLRPLPATDDPEDTVFSGDLGVGVAVNANSKHLDIAKEFVAFLAQPENINAYADVVGGVIPAASEGFEPVPLLETFAEFSEAGRTLPFPQYAGPVRQIQEVMITEIQNMWLGGGSPTKVVEEMQRAFDAG